VTARHKAYDALRREAARPGKELAAAGGAALVEPDLAPEVLDMVEPETVVRDDQLRLMFTCCHPALAREAQVALALRTLAGLGVAGVPRGVFGAGGAVGQRVARAPAKMRHGGGPERGAAGDRLP